MGLVISFILNARLRLREWFVDPYISVMTPDGKTCMAMSLGKYIASYHVALTENYGDVTRECVVTHQTNPIDLGKEKGLAFCLAIGHPLVIILGTLKDVVGYDYFVEVRDEGSRVIIKEEHIKVAVDKVMEYFRDYNLPVKNNQEEEEEGNPRPRVTFDFNTKGEDQNKEEKKER